MDKKHYVRVNGTDFCCRGKKLNFGGLGVGTWLNLEHFMLGLPTPEKQIKEAFAEVFGKEREEQFFDDFVLNFCAEADFKLMKETGINLIRVPFNYRLFIDDKNPSQLKEEGFRYFDRLISLCTKYQIYVLPDLHAVPGGQNPDWHSDNQTGIPQFWHFDVFQQQVVMLWQEIARRYAEEPYILGYDLLNEPYLMPAEDGVLQRFYERVTAAVREVDQNHIIFLEGDYFAMDFSALDHIADEQTALTFHFYPTVWEADLCDRDYDRAKRRVVFEDRFCRMLEGLRRFGRPLLCGEAGYDIRGNEMSHVLEMVEDTLDLFVKYDVSWTLWCYKDADFMGLVYPQKDSPWMQFAEEIHSSWTHYREMKEGRELVEEMSRLFERDVDEEWKYQLQFRQRALLFSLQKEYILKPQLERWGWERIKEMPKSFAMENCSYHEEYQRVLKEYTKILQ